MTLGLAKCTAAAALPLVEVTVSTAAFCFDGQGLRLLVRKGAQEGFDLPSTPFLPGTSVTECASDALERVGLRQFQQVHQVSALESQSHSTLGLPAGLNILALAVCKPQALLETPDLRFETLVWTPVSEQALLGPSLRAKAELALALLRNKARFDSLAFDFLCEEFSLSELQRVFEAILGRPIDVRNFRKKIDALDLLFESPNKPKGMAYRPPRLFRFVPSKFAERRAVDGEIRFF